MISREPTQSPQRVGGGDWQIRKTGGERIRRPVGLPVHLEALLQSLAHEGDQVGHLLLSHPLFQAFRHERKAPA